MHVERNAVSQSMSLLLESMNEQSRQQLDQWIPEIEEQAIKNIAGLTSYQISSRKQEILVAASLYQAFREFENRTRLIVRTPFFSKVLNLSSCSINQAYCRLFDRKVRVLHHRVECIRMLSEDPADLVVEIVASLVNALEEQAPRAIEWFAGVQKAAIVMVNALRKTQQETYEPDAIAAAAVFGAVQRQLAGEVIHVAQKDIAMTCRFSQAMVSKIWLELFCEGRLSSITKMEERGTIG
jgi:vesicle coat complex subunit